MLRPLETKQKKKKNAKHEGCNSTGERHGGSIDEGSHLI